MHEDEFVILILKSHPVGKRFSSIWVLSAPQQSFDILRRFLHLPSWPDLILARTHDRSLKHMSQQAFGLREVISIATSHPILLRSNDTHYPVTALFPSRKGKASRNMRRGTWKTPGNSPLLAAPSLHEFMSVKKSPPSSPRFSSHKSFIIGTTTNVHGSRSPLLLSACKTFQSIWKFMAPMREQPEKPPRTWLLAKRSLLSSNEIGLSHAFENLP